MAEPTVLMSMLQFKKIFMASDLEVRNTTVRSLNAGNNQQFLSILRFLGQQYQQLQNIFT